MAVREIRDKLKQFKIGEELFFETEKELLVGKLQCIDVNFNFVRLAGVKDLKNNVNYTSAQLVPLKRVKCIRSVRQDETPYASAVEDNDEKSSPSSSDDSSASSVRPANSFTKENDVKLGKMQLSPFQLQLLQKQMDSVKVLTCRGQEYNDAISDIKSRSCVALHVEPSRCGRNRKTTIITIATENTAYLFDILALGKVFEDLKAILRAEIPCKIVFNGRLIADHFQHRQNLFLNGISDAFVAYSIVTKQKQNFEFEDVIAEYFGFSKDFFTQHLPDSHILYSRPLQESFVSNCAKKAVFLYKLEEYLRREMLKTYFSQCKSFSRTFADNEDSSEVSNSIEVNDRSGHHLIRELDLNDQSL